ncbi:MAG TPA: efflux RND transporter periplasmic adaptor subunit [Candidatus Omnitrophota bacterium]|nr:efflux RND transporter periplasmic adaptor subunit [Candidatus Omnitrophota bacterium]
MTQEKSDGKLEEPILFKEPDKKSTKVRGAWFFILLLTGGFYLLSGTGQTRGEGTLKAYKHVTLQAQVPGRLIEIMRKKGEAVQMGEILAHFENSGFPNKLALKQKSLEINEENLKGIQEKESHLKAKIDRASILSENGVIGKSDFEDISLEYKSAQKEVLLQTKQVEALREEVAYLTSEIEKLKLKAPIAGVLLSDPSEKIYTHFDVGAEAFEIGDPSSFYVEMPVRESQIGSVHIGDSAAIQFDAVPLRKYSGIIVGIGVKTDQEVEKVFKVKHVVVCEIKLNEDVSGLRFGMQAKVVIHSARKIIPNFIRNSKPKGESDFDGTFKL